MADSSYALAKRRRRQAWRASHKLVREVNTQAQKFYRRSQKILDQPSMISSQQVAIFARELGELETAVAAVGRALGIVVQIVRESA